MTTNRKDNQPPWSIISIYVRAIPCCKKTCACCLIHVTTSSGTKALTFDNNRISEIFSDWVIEHKQQESLVADYWRIIADAAQKEAFPDLDNAEISKISFTDPHGLLCRIASDRIKSFKVKLTNQ